MLLSLTNLFWALVAVVSIEHLPSRKPLQGPTQGVNLVDFQRNVEKRVKRVGLVATGGALDLAADHAAKDAVDEGGLLDGGRWARSDLLHDALVHAVEQGNEVLVGVLLMAEPKAVRHVVSFDLCTSCVHVLVQCKAERVCVTMTWRSSQRLAGSARVFFLHTNSAQSPQPSPHLLLSFRRVLAWVSGGTALERVENT